MATLNILVAVSLGYVAFLFMIAFAAEQAAARGQAGWLRSRWVYTLSLSIYCTAWTFYGAVGYAARAGLEYLTIYIGPSLVMIGWWWFLHRLVQVGRRQRATSIADLISARYGKSGGLAILATLLAVIGTTPYIALQLQSVTLTFDVLARAPNAAGGPVVGANTAFWVAAGLALFTILFGTRNLDVNERHHGVVIAIAVEAIVKLFALLAVGVFVVWGISGGVDDVLGRIDSSAIGMWHVQAGRWVGLIFLSGAAFLCLPRMFQVMVVEYESDKSLRTASWAFPAYLMLMSLFVVPIAVVGLQILPPGSNPDLFVLTIPLAMGNEALAMLAFLGGFSSATSMVIVAAIALSTMVSNHIVMPIWLAATGRRATLSGDVRVVVLRARRLSIAGLLMLGYLYYRLTGGGAALASIGLISFVGVAQFLPALVGGFFWRGATRIGAFAGLGVGFVVWAYAMLLPEVAAPAVISADLIAHGPFGVGWLRPQALFGISGLDPLVHAILWSISLNGLAFVLGSVFSVPSALERLQGAQFMTASDRLESPQGWSASRAQGEDLMLMAQRILGAGEAQQLFAHAADAQGVRGAMPDLTPEFLQKLERKLAGSVGAATAHAMIRPIVGGAVVSVSDLMAVADEAAQIMEYSNQLEAKSSELARTAQQLRQANEKLTQLSAQKDTFLSQISHELRTPMTSIRAFSEILRDAAPSAAQKREFAGIIHDEALRLTRLLDDLLDLTVLENGQVHLNPRNEGLFAVIELAVLTASGGARGANSLRIERDVSQEKSVRLHTDVERLGQVFINVISNARKYCDGVPQILTIRARVRDGAVVVDFTDNGSGIAPPARGLIFEKFSQAHPQRAGGAGLGLAICREIMARLGGSIAYVPQGRGTTFRVILPVVDGPRAAQA